MQVFWLHDFKFLFEFILFMVSGLFDILYLPPREFMSFTLVLFYVLLSACKAPCAYRLLHAYWEKKNHGARRLTVRHPVLIINRCC